MSATLRTPESVLKWIKKRSTEMRLSVRPIKFADSKEWSFTDKHSVLRHSSGKFFTIEGVRCLSDYYEDGTAEQPIINQDEVGILGVLLKMVNGEPHILIQLKPEPGNINLVQLAPTVQATESNYKQVHGGSPQPYIEYFLDPKENGYEVLYDQLQSEQGTRFLRKKNRNIAILLNKDENPDTDTNFKWIPLSVIQKLLSEDNIVNTDLRSVLASLLLSNGNMVHLSNNPTNLQRYLYHSLTCDSGNTFTRLNDVDLWLSSLRKRYRQKVSRIPLSELRDWEVTNDRIQNTTRNEFLVKQIAVETDVREVSTWDQPIISSQQKGLNCMLCQNIFGTPHFLVKGCVEPGNADTVELTCGIQLDEGKANNPADKRLYGRVSSENLKAKQVLLTTVNSEEGGRFYHDENTYLIYLIHGNIKLDLPDNYTWLTLQQLGQLVQSPDYITNDLRSAIAIVFSLM